MNALKPIAAVALLGLAADGLEDVYKGNSPEFFEWLNFGNRALGIAANPALETHQGQTRIYRQINDPANPNDDKWVVANLEINGQPLTFDTNKGDSLQPETDATGTVVSLRIGTLFEGNRYYAVLSVPPVDSDGDGVADRHLTAPGAFTESTTFYQQQPNTINQVPGTDTITINGRTIVLP